MYMVIAFKHLNFNMLDPGYRNLLKFKRKLKKVLKWMKE